MAPLWIWVLLAAGLVLLLAEVFVPSHGLLGVSGAGALIISLAFAFKASAVLGVIVVILIVVLLPIEIVVGVRLFPATPLGRRMMLEARAKTTKADTASEGQLLEYVGKDGVTVTMCRPAGIADIAGRRVDVVAEGTMIDINRPVTVLRVDGNRVVVREKQL